MRFAVLPFDLAQGFAKRAQNAIPFPRGAVSFRASAAAAVGSPRFGVFASLGAVALGALMLTANLAHQPPAPALADSTPVAATPAQDIAAAPTPLATAAPAAPASPGPVAKSTARVDMAATGAIEKPAPAKLPPKPHKAKKKKTAKADE